MILQAGLGEREESMMTHFQLGQLEVMIAVCFCFFWRKEWFLLDRCKCLWETEVKLSSRKLDIWVWSSSRKTCARDNLGVFRLKMAFKAV